MNEFQANFNKTKIHFSRFDTAIEWLLIVLLAFMPLVFGVVHAWSEEVVIVLTGAVVICFLLKLIIHRDQKLVWSWAYIPIVLFLFVVVFQLIPLPIQLMSIISPNTAVLKTELLGDLPEADTLLKTMPLSFYPHATEHGLQHVLVVVAIFIVVLNVFRRPDQIKRLLMAIAVIGGLIAVITLAQNIFGNGKIYWFISSRNSNGYSGPFVNHSNYGQFMNLSIGAALSLLIVKLHETFTCEKVTPTAFFERLEFRSAKSSWLLVGVMSVGAATIFTSLTRGGMVSMLIALAITVGLFALQRSLTAYSWIMVITALIAFICVLYIGFDAVYERLLSLRDFDNAEAGRLQILKDIAIMWTMFPVLGTGLDTHSVVYPIFDRSMITALASHAENEYAQMLEETGLVGLGLLISFGIIVLSTCVRNIRNNKQPICLATYGLCFGILAILIHSLSDFGQHLPANAILSATFCALLLAIAQSGQNSNRSAAYVLTPSRKRIALRVIVASGVCILWVWILTSADNARIAETHWQRALEVEEGLKKKSWRGTDAEYANLISHATAAADFQPDNIKYKHWLNVYRWHSICQVTNPDTGAVIISVDSMPTIKEIVTEFHKVLAMCPTNGPTYSIVGQIENVILNDESGAEKIRKGFRLAPCNPAACFIVGWLDFMEGKTQDSIAKFERAVQLDPSLFNDVIYIYVHYLNRPRIAISAAGDNIGWLTHVTDVLEDMQYKDLAEEAREKIKNLLEAKCTEPAIPGSVYAHLGSIYGEQNDNEAAVECFRHALAREYSQVYWRLELSKLLVKMERVPEALNEARICLKLQPEFKAAEVLVKNLCVNPAVFDEEN